MHEQKLLDEQKLQQRARLQLRCFETEIKQPKIRFTVWEENFINDLSSTIKINPAIQFTSKQIQSLEKIWKDRQ